MGPTISKALRAMASLTMAAARFVIAALKLGAAAIDEQGREGQILVFLQALDD